MKKAFLLVAAVMALQTTAYAGCGGCTPLGCRNDATFNYCQANCSDDQKFSGCQKSHDAGVEAAQKKAAALAQIEADYQANLAAAAANAENAEGDSDSDGN